MRACSTNRQKVIKFHNVGTFKDNKTLARLLWGARELGGNSECYGCTFWPQILETFRIKN